MAYSKAPLTKSPFQPDALSQFLGQASQEHDCGVTITREEIRATTLGVKDPSTSAIRAATGMPNWSGVAYPELIKAASATTGGEVQLRALYNVPTSAIKDALSAGRLVGIMVDASKLLGTPWHVGTFTGLHEEIAGTDRYATVTRADGSTYQQYQYGMMDPGVYTYYVRWRFVPAYIINRAALAVTGGHGVLLLTTRDFTNVSRKALSSGHFHSTTVMTSSNESGNIVGGQAYTVQTTVRGSGYPANGHTARGWSKVASNKYAIGTRIR